MLSLKMIDYSRNILPSSMKDGVQVTSSMNTIRQKHIGQLYLKKGSYRTYFDIIEVGHIPKEIKKVSGKKKYSRYIQNKSP